MVAPFMGGRGLKFLESEHFRFRIPVAPFRGVWIEIAKAGGAGLQHSVAPFTGAWIENATTYGSLPAVYALVPLPPQV